MAAIPTNLPQTLPSGAPVQSAQVRAAQAAFFRAALNEVQTAPAPSPLPSPSGPVSASSEAAASRLPRLGQLLDIRV